MKVTRKIVREYACGTCGTKYSSVASCKKCEAMPTEALIANIGNRVRITEKRTCSGNGEDYVAEGKIVDISPPLPYDQEYEAKWLHSKTKVHRRAYLVHYKCPKCGQIRDQPVFSTEFTILNARK